MVAQTNVDVLAPVFAWLVAAGVAFGPVAAGLTKLVDAARGLFDKNDTAPKWTWIVLAFVFALAICLLFEINLVGDLFKQLPTFSESDALAGVWGQVLTAFGMAGFASYWHGRMELASSTAKAAYPPKP